MKRTWWKEAVVYQIYPRSFYDSNRDGIGDIQGIIQKLDYLKELGVDVIWLNPVYESPNDDNGYDISNYKSIMKEFGTMEDFDELLDQVHARGMKLIMDLVVNHSSDEHPWFIESRKSKNNPYRDYYIWREDKGGKIPTNWRSWFSGSVWEYDPKTKAYYMHLFSKKQPDLNWDNPKLRREVYAMMRWWLDKGVDGFRMDAINFISKADGLPDAGPIGTDGLAWAAKYFANGPRVHEYLQEMHHEVLSHYDIMTVGEVGQTSLEDGILYVLEDGNEFNMLFHFEHTELDFGREGKWTPRQWKLTELKKIMTKWQVELYQKGWNSLYFNNHDTARMVSRFGNDDVYRKESAKMLATCLHMMQGTPYIYQGEEIGMTNVQFNEISMYRDVEIHNKYLEVKKTGSLTEDEFMQGVYANGRDNARTPMQWNNKLHAGFTEGEPWILVNPNYLKINVEEAIKDDNSIFQYYQKLIQMRKDHPIMVYGKYEELLEDHEQVFVYMRVLEDERWLILLNFCDETVDVKLPKEISLNSSELMIANYDQILKTEDGQIILRPYEAQVQKLRS